MKRNLSKGSFSALTLLLFFILSISSVHAALNVTLSNQGTDVKNRATGNLLAVGNLTVEVYDAATGGNLAYSETFRNAISNGQWNVLLGENTSNPLPLEFGRQYFMNYKINNEDVNFTNFTGGTIDRQPFYAPLGDISDEDINDNTNLTLGQKITFALGEIIDNIADGYIRLTGNVNVTNNLTIANQAFIGNPSSVLFGGDALQVGGNIYLGSGNPTIDLDDQGQTADNRTYQIVNTNRQFIIRAINNAGSLSANAIVINRTGTSIDQVVFPNGNIGIGTTEPVSKLQVNSEISIGATDNDRGIITYSAGTNDYLTFGTRSDSTNYFSTVTIKQGNVGIGTISPNRPLHVKGTNFISQFEGTDTNLSFYADAGGAGLFVSPTNILTNSGGFYIEPDYDVVYIVNGTSANVNFTIKNNGRVGIGTTSPANLLNVLGDANITGTLYAGTFTPNGLVSSTLNVSGQTLLATSSGNVGIGTTNPHTKLTVNASTVDGISIVRSDQTIINSTWFVDNRWQENGFSFTTSGQQTLFMSASDGDIIIGDIGAGPSSATGSKLTINGGVNIGHAPSTTAPSDGLLVEGKVGINTTSPSQLFEVAGNANITGTLYTGSNIETVNIFGNEFTFNKFIARGNTNYFVDPDDTSTSAALAGKVGINTTAPANLLNVLGDANITGTLYAGTFSPSNVVTSTLNVSGQTLLATSNGNVGIGTTNPSTLLHLNGSASPTITLTDTTNSLTGRITATDNELAIGTTSSHPLYLQVNSQNLISLPTTGNVGIGTDNPTQKLNVIGDANITGTLYAGTFSPSALSTSVLNVSGQTLLATSSGNVGIGTTSPATRLHVLGTASTEAKLRLGYITGAFDGFYGELAQKGDAAGGLNIDSSSQTNSGAAGIVFRRSVNSGSSFTESMRIDKDGNVGIGTASPTNKLNVVGDANITGALYVNGTQITGGPSSQWTTTGGDIYYQNLTGRVGIGTASPQNKFHVAAENGNEINFFDQIFIDSSPSTTNSSFPVRIALGTLNSTTIRLFDGSTQITNAKYSFVNVHNGSGSPQNNVLVESAPYVLPGSGAFVNLRAFNYPIVDGATTNANVQGINTRTLRNLIATPYLDNGTATLLVGINVLYGHSSTNASANPQTTTAYGLQLQPQALTGNITTLYNLRIETLGSSNTRVINHYGIAQEDSLAKNYLLGNVSIGANSPTRNLKVIGDAEVTTSAFLATSSGNVGINTTSPANLLNVLGDANITGTLYAGTFSPSNVVTSTLNVSGQTLLATSGGNVGIGTASPTAKLHISAATTGTNNTIRAIDSNSALGASFLIGWSGASANNKYKGFVVDSEGFKFGGFNDSFNIFTTHLVINNSGHIAIGGDTSPDALLEVEQSPLSASSDLFMVGSSGGGNGDYLIVKNGGKVGIGTSSPTHKLNVAGDANITGTLYVNGVVLNASQLISSQWTASGGNIYYRNLTGNVGIGTTAPTTGRLVLYDTVGNTAQTIYNWRSVSSASNSHTALYNRYDLALASNDSGADNYYNGLYNGVTVTGGNETASYSYYPAGFINSYNYNTKNPGYEPRGIQNIMTIGANAKEVTGVYGFHQTVSLAAPDDATGPPATGIVSEVQHTTNSTIPSINNLYLRNYLGYPGGGNVTTSTGIYNLAWLQTYNMTLTNYYGIKNELFNYQYEGSNITNAYGVYLTSLKSDNVANAYAIYQAGTQDRNVFLGGKGFSIGTTANYGGITHLFTSTEGSSKSGIYNTFNVNYPKGDAQNYVDGIYNVFTESGGNASSAINYYHSGIQNDYTYSSNTPIYGIYGMRQTVTVNPAATQSTTQSDISGLRLYTNLARLNTTVDALAGIDTATAGMYAYNSTINILYGIKNQATLHGDNVTANNIFGSYNYITSSGGNTKAGNVYGVYINVQPGVTTNKWTNGYGLYIESVNNSYWTNPPYGIYQGGLQDKNYFAGRVGIGISSPSYPLEVSGSGVSGVSIYASGNVSAAGYITRTDVWDSENDGKALDYLKDSSELLNPDGSINHKAFGLSYVTYPQKKIAGYLDEFEVSRVCEPKKVKVKKNLPGENGTIKIIEVEEEQEDCSKIEKKTVQKPIYEDSIEEGVDLVKEIAFLRQALYELSQEVGSIKGVDYKKNLTQMPSNQSIQGSSLSGQTKIEPGFTEASLEFKEAFAEAPIVTVTPVGLPNFFYGVTDVTATGFSVVISQVQTKEVSFAWRASQRNDNSSSFQKKPGETPKDKPSTEDPDDSLDGEDKSKAPKKEPEAIIPENESTNLPAEDVPAENSDNLTEIIDSEEPIDKIPDSLTGEQSNISEGEAKITLTGQAIGKDTSQGSWNLKKMFSRMFGFFKK